MARYGINMDGEHKDPMDSMFTQNVSIDLTRRPEQSDKIPNTPVSLEDLGGDKKVNIEKETPQPPEPPVEEEKPKVKAKAVNATMGQNVQEFDPTTIIPKKEKKDPGVNEIFANLDAAVNREKESITNRMNALEEKMYEDYMDSQVNGDGDPTAASTSSTSTEEVYTRADPEDAESDLYSDGEEVYEQTTSEVNKQFVPYVETSSEKVEDKAEEEHKEVKAYVPEKETKAEEPKPKVEEKNEEPSVRPFSITKNVNDDLVYDDKELEEDLENASNAAADQQKKQEEEVRDIVDGLKAAAKSTIRPAMPLIDLSKFKIADKGVKASTVILRDTYDPDVADWVMFNTGRPISMTGLTGPELIKLDPDNSTRNRANTIRDIYKIIYDHVVDSKKPSFTDWLKQTKYTDLDHIYFALYMATFGKSNYISYQCPECKTVFIKDDVKFEDMVQYKDDSVKNKVKEILSMSTDNGIINYQVDLVPAGHYAFGMRSPSLYNVAIETAGLPDSIMDKYSDLIDTITYIDSVYTIDNVNMQLIPVIIPFVKDDPIKSTIKRIKTLYDILKRLSSDEYYILRGYITKLADTSAELSYKIPAAKCTECDKEIPENTETSASDLLFTRHHLGAFANM